MNSQITLLRNSRAGLNTQKCGDRSNFMTWTAPCQVCGRKLEKGVGLFCGNFLIRRERSTLPCLTAYCGECYTVYPNDPFPIQDRLGDEDEEDEGFETDDPASLRFRRGRNGDHLMGVPFECDVCQFNNVYKRAPNFNKRQDRYALLVIRRVSLDVMWSREPSTVEGNLSRARLDYSTTQGAFDFPRPLPLLGRSEVSDPCGMQIAMQTIHMSLRKGRHAATLQVDTMRRTRTWISSAYRAGEGAFNHGATLASSHRGVLYITDGPVHSEWHHRFEEGYRKRMGIIRKQNEALVVGQLLVMLTVAEEDYQKATSAAVRRDIVSLMAFVVIGFMISLRGEEVPLCLIEGTLDTWLEDFRYKIPHITIALRGRFKREDTMRYHLVPIADSSKSKVPTRRWITRQLAERKRVDGKTKGWMFVNKKGKRARISDFDDLFRAYVKKAHARKPKEFPSGTDFEQYSLRRSLRRGSTTTAGNNQVPEQVVNRINRWRKDNNSRGGDPMAGLTMREVYIAVRNSADAALAYSLSH